MQSLLSAIEHAFASAVLPSGDLIAMPTVDDEGISQFFRGRTWKSLTAQQLREQDFAPTIFTPAAFAYFAPAYITAYVVAPNTLDSAVENFIHNLGSGNDPAIPQYHRAREIYRRFSSEQLEVVRAFLRLYVANEFACGHQFAEQALSLYDAA